MKHLLLSLSILFLFSCKKADNIQPSALRQTETTFTIDYREETVSPLRSVIYYCIDKQPADSIVIGNTGKATIAITKTIGYQLFIWASGRRQYQYTLYDASNYKELAIYRDPAMVNQYSPCEFKNQGTIAK